MSAATAAKAFGGKEKRKEPVIIDFCLAEDAPGDSLTAVTLQKTDRTIWLHATPVVTNQDITSMRIIVAQSQMPSLEIKLTREAGDRLRRVTTENHLKSLAIRVDGEVLAAPTIHGTIGAEWNVALGQDTPQLVNLVTRFQNNRNSPLPKN